jgi:hypothetical protein
VQDLGMNDFRLSLCFILSTKHNPNEGVSMARGEGGQDKGKAKGKPKLTTKEKQDKKKEKAKGKVK